MREKIVLAAALLALVSGLLQMASPFDGNGDVSWLIVVGEKVLGGQRLYTDILETNPPMTIYLYLVPIWVAIKTGIAAELTVHAWVLGWAAVSVWATWRLSEVAGIVTTLGRWIFAGCAAYALVILPGWSFGQREQLAAIGLLPYLMLTAGRLNGFAPSGLATLSIGVLAGLAVCIKPHFALMMVFPTLVRVAADRRMSSLFTAENFAAGGVAVAYLAAVVLAYPEFFGDMMEMNRHAYIPSKLTPAALVGAPASLLVLAVVVIAVVARSWFAAGLPFVLLAAAAGSLCAYVIQAKGWPYHQIPTLIFGMLALAVGFIQTCLERRPGADSVPGLDMRDSLAALAALALLGFFGPQVFSMRGNSKALEAEIAKYSPAPSLMIASSNLGMHFPLVRRTNARWESRASSLWMLEGAARLLPTARDPAHREALVRFYQREREAFAEDAVRARPDMLGLAYLDAQRNNFSWAREVPALKQLLEHYEQVAVVDDVALLVRKDLLAAKASNHASGTAADLKRVE